MLNTKDQGKTLTIDYNNTIVELSKSSFTLPRTKNASESFTVKSKKNQAFSLTPKIGTEPFTKRDFSATKDIPAPTEAQLTLKEFTPTVTGGTFPDKPFYSLEFFKDKFYLFPRSDGGKYYSSDDGQTWKDEGKLHAAYPTNATVNYTFVFKNKLWISNGTDKILYSAETPNGTNFKKIGSAIPGSILNFFTIFENKIWYRSTESIYSSIDGITWNEDLRIIDNKKHLKNAAVLSYEGKIWSFGGVNDEDGNGTIIELTSKVFSYDGTNLVEESNLPKKVEYTSAKVFANGLFVMGGLVDLLDPGNSEIYWSAYGKRWQKVNTTDKLDDLEGNIFGGATLKSENEMWIVKKTGGNPKVYRLRFAPNP